MTTRDKLIPKKKTLFVYWVSHFSSGFTGFLIKIMKNGDNIFFFL